MPCRRNGISNVFSSKERMTGQRKKTSGNLEETTESENGRKSERGGERERDKEENE